MTERYEVKYGKPGEMHRKIVECNGVNVSTVSSAGARSMSAYDDSLPDGDQTVFELSVGPDHILLVNRIDLDDD